MAFHDLLTIFHVGFMFFPWRSMFVHDFFMTFHGVSWRSVALSPGFTPLLHPTLTSSAPLRRCIRSPPRRSSPRRPRSPRWPPTWLRDHGLGPERLSGRWRWRSRSRPRRLRSFTKMGPQGKACWRAVFKSYFGRRCHVLKETGAKRGLGVA